MKFTSPVFSAVSGSIAGVTYSRNKGGMYVRARAVPTNPNTTRQQNNRSQLGLAVQAWNAALSDEQRESWREYAANVPVLDRLGQMKHLTGQQMWIRWNVAFHAAGGDPEPILMSAPFNTGEPVQMLRGTISQEQEIGIETSEADYNSQIIWADDTSAAARVSFFMSVALNAGRNFWKGPYQLVQGYSVASGTDEIAVDTSFASQLNSNGAPVVGERRAVRIVTVYNDGRVAQPYEAVLPVVNNVTP